MLASDHFIDDLGSYMAPSLVVSPYSSVSDNKHTAQGVFHNVSFLLYGTSIYFEWRFSCRQVKCVSETHPYIGYIVF